MARTLATPEHAPWLHPSVRIGLVFVASSAHHRTPSMPQPIALYRVFLAAPSDVTDELIVVEGVLRMWTLGRGQAKRDQ